MHVCMCVCMCVCTFFSSSNVTKVPKYELKRLWIDDLGFEASGHALCKYVCMCHEGTQE
jgi:hypothetical protein